MAQQGEGERLASRLKLKDRCEDEVFSDLGNAIDFVTKQLRVIKTQDRDLMRQFVQLRSQINTFKEGRPVGTGPERRASLLNIPIDVDPQFAGVRDCNLDPFDTDLKVGPRRRAFSSLDKIRSRDLEHSPFLGQMTVGFSAAL